MIPWPDATFERDLRHLLSRARKTSKRGLNVASGPMVGQQIIRMTAGGNLVLVEGDDVTTLRRLEMRLAGSSRRRVGFSADEAGALLIQACDRAVTGTIKGAVDELNEMIRRPLAEFEITEPVTFLLGVPRLVVGRTTYLSKMPKHYVLTAGMDKHGFVAPVACTTVACRAAGTAKVLARRNFAESLAILDLLARQMNTGAEATGTRIVAGHGAGGVGLQKRGPYVDARFVRRARLVPPLRELAGAAAKPEAARTDWEQRMVAGTRWYSNAYRTEGSQDRPAAQLRRHAPGDDEARPDRVDRASLEGTEQRDPRGTRFRGRLECGSAPRLDPGGTPRAGFSPSAQPSIGPSRALSHVAGDDELHRGSRLALPVQILNPPS